MRKILALLLAAAMSFGAISTSYALPQQQTKHLKKDGTPDKRYKENKQHLKKDGTPDMRYKENKKKKS